MCSSIPDDFLVVVIGQNDLNNKYVVGKRYPKATQLVALPIIYFGVLPRSVDLFCYASSINLYIFYACNDLHS